MQLIVLPYPDLNEGSLNQNQVFYHWTIGQYKNVTFQLSTWPGMNNSLSEIVVNYSLIWLRTEASFAYRSSFYYVRVFKHKLEENWFQQLVTLSQDYQLPSARLNR